MSEMRLQLQDQIKRVHDDVTAVQTSLSNAWLEIESLKADAEGNKQKIEELDKQVRTLKAEMEAEKHKRLQLDMYLRRENLRLIGIQEKEQEDVEKIVRGILDEMGVLRDNLEFHAVHRVSVKKQVGEYLDHPDGPKQYNRQIIMRFVNRQDRDRVWMNKEKIKNSKNYSSAFFIQDFPKEIADERAKLRKIAKNAKDNNIQVEIRKNKIFVVSSQMSYGLKEIPDFFKDAISR